MQALASTSPPPEGWLRRASAGFGWLARKLSAGFLARSGLDWARDFDLVLASGLNSLGFWLDLV